MKNSIKNIILRSIEKDGYFSWPSRKTYIHHNNTSREVWNECRNAFKELILEKKIDWTIDFDGKKYLFTKYEETII